ncbi:MAG: tetratricopeptide repeat protein [Bryobacterales bacterium]|nr:tetratricopeptide repeat protein [Bryobacteraceae bacterium]MDW8352937.1 tetratricopeptide repeat protein [Bryobacterales bacterium]
MRAVLLALLVPGILAAQIETPPPLPFVSAPLSPQRRAAVEQALAARQFEQAEALLQEAAAARPDSQELWKLLAGVSFLGGKYWNAVRAFHRARELAPLDASSRFTLAMAYVAVKRRDLARAELAQLNQARPDNALYWYWLARLDYDDQQFQTAAERLRRAIELQPGFVRAHDNLGLCLEALGRFEEAVASYQQAVRLNREQTPASPWPALNLGTLLLKLGRIEEAEPYLREAVRFGPRLAPARLRLGVLLEKRGAVEEAIQELRRAAELDPRSPDPHYALARLYRRQGDAAAAAAALAEFERLRKARRDR